MIHLENRMPRIARTPAKSATVQKIRFAKRQMVRSSSFFRYRAKTGMNDADSDPSPTKRLKRFGIRNAKMNESAATDVPSSKVMRWSRTYPQIRLTMVIRVITEADFKICLFSVNRQRLRS